MEYRGIQLDDSVKFFKKDGSINKNVKRGLDKLINTIENKSHKLLSAFKTTQDNILIDFGCHHEPHLILPNNYLKGQDCPCCNGKCYQHMKKNFEEMVKNNGHILLSEYKSALELVKIDFNCGHEPHEITPNEYKKGCRCGCCSPTGCVQHAKEKFVNLVKENGHILLNNYSGALERVLIDFNCGHEPHWIRVADYKKSSKCACCNNCCRQHAGDKLVKIVKNNGHTLLSDYESAFEEVLIDFNCGHEPQLVKASPYKRGIQGCSECIECKSKGEKIIKFYLEENNINYKEQYKFSKSRKAKKYDFCLIKENIIVEVHGKQHYEKSGFTDLGGRTLEEEQANDKYKKEYAISQGFRYIEVDYKEHIPELALERFIEQYNNLQKEG